MVSPRARALLDQLVAAPQPTPLQDVASVGRTHALAETMNALMPPIMRLVCPFHCYLHSCPDEDCEKSIPLL